MGLEVGESLDSGTEDGTSRVVGPSVGSSSVGDEVTSSTGAALGTVLWAFPNETLSSNAMNKRAQNFIVLNVPIRIYSKLKMCEIRQTRGVVENKNLFTCCLSSEVLTPNRQMDFFD